MRRFEPTRRNRNIGTARQGHGQNNRLTIPVRGENSYWERIDSATEVSRVIADRAVRFFVQPTTRGCFHFCTVDDIAHIFAHVPRDDWDGIGAIVLRQPRRKQQILAPVWGRLAYAADLVTASGKITYSGPAIILEACNPSACLKFGRSVSPDGMDELERLRMDGHEIRPGRTYTIHSTGEACRRTQLYRTLLHELGHWVEFVEKVERFSSESPERYEALLDRFHNRPNREKEHFAHRYAERMSKRLTEMHVIPFERRVGVEQLQVDGLSSEDFLF